MYEHLIIAPNQTTQGSDNLEEALKAIAEAFLREPRDKEYYSIVLYEGYNRRVCDLIVSCYKHAGWGTVECENTSTSTDTTNVRLWR